MVAYQHPYHFHSNQGALLAAAMWHTCGPYVDRGAFAFLEPEQLWPTESVAGIGGRRVRRLRRVIWGVFSPDALCNDFGADIGLILGLQSSGVGI